MTTDSQLKARWLAATLILGLGLWTLRDFLMPIAWSVVLALTLSPLYDALDLRLKGRHPVLTSLGLTLALALVLYGPVSYGLVRVLNEMQSLTALLHQIQQDGLDPPAWLAGLPFIGSELSTLWDHWLRTPEAIRDMAHSLLSSGLPAKTRHLAAFLVHRFASSFFLLLLFFFILLNRALLQAEVLRLANRLFGEEGGRYAIHAANAVRATVNGIVLVALGQGVALGAGYMVAGFEHVALLSLVTAVVALIPFAAKILSLAAALLLISKGAVAAGVLFLMYGLIVVLVADNYVKPRLIGNQVKLPFIWTLLGILGGIESFGFLGLFLGPTLMAILISVWRDSQDPSAA